MVYGYLGSTRAPLVLPDVCRHSGYSQNPLTVPEVVGDTWVMVSLHLALLDFTRDAQHSWQGKQSCWDHSPQILNLLGTNVGHYRS